MKIFNIQLIAYCLLGCLLGFAACTSAPRQVEKPAKVQQEEKKKHLFKNGIRIDSLTTKDYHMQQGDYLGSILLGLGLSHSLADSVIRSSADVLDPKKLQADMPYTAFYTKEEEPRLKYISFGKSALEDAIIEFSNGEVLAYSYKQPVHLVRKYTEGVLSSSLWNAIVQSGNDPLLALHLSDVYAWQIDFFDVKEGDSFKVMYDVAYVNDTTALYISSIVGASFTHQGKEFIAIPFVQDGVREFFDEKGLSLRKSFLKAPLDFFRITSHFSNARFHPILKRYRAHHGVDYAAPTGTPVKSIGSGKVIAKAYQRGGGNYIKVKHNAVYSTTYMHLSRFAKGLHVGQTVQQGEVIGYVGSTGLSTGPHLDFRVYKNGQAINPLSMEAPPLKPVPPALLDSFMNIKAAVLKEMEQHKTNKH